MSSKRSFPWMGLGFIVFCLLVAGFAWAVLVERPYRFEGRKALAMQEIGGHVTMMNLLPNRWHKAVPEGLLKRFDRIQGVDLMAVYRERVAPIAIDCQGLPHLRHVNVVSYLSRSKASTKTECSVDVSDCNRLVKLSSVNTDIHITGLRKTSLQAVDFDHCTLSFDEEMPFPSSVESLTLKYNKMAPIDLFAFREFETLSIIGTGMISRLPETYSDNLTFLKLGKTEHAIPSFRGKASLKNLYLFDDTVTNVDVSACSEMTHLHVRSKGLESLTLPAGNSLQHLTLDGLDPVPDFSNHHDLKTMYFSRCRVTLPPNAFPQLNAASFMECIDLELPDLSLQTNLFTLTVYQTPLRQLPALPDNLQLLELRGTGFDERSFQPRL